MKSTFHAGTSGGVPDTGEKFGRAMLEKMGWKEGTGLGANRDGRVEPLLPKSRQENLGVGAQRDRPFCNDWWAKDFKEAFGKPGVPSVELDDAALFAACGGRRCRPVGAAKLARIEKADGCTSLKRTRTTPSSSRSGDSSVDGEMIPKSGGESRRNASLETSQGGEQDSKNDKKREKRERKERRRAKRARRAEKKMREKTGLDRRSGRGEDTLGGSIKKKRRREQ